MTFAFRIAPLVLLAAAATAAAQQRPPIRQLGATVATSTEPFVSVAGVRPLASGGLLVNDVAGRRVVMFDPALRTFTIVADSTSATGNAYGGNVGSLIAFRGDSSLFVDPASVSMLVIDPSGKVARVIAIPRAEDARMLGGPLGNAAIDGSGRLVYRAGGGTRTVSRVAGPGGGGPRSIAPPEVPDSALIIRVDLATRKVDTLGFIRTPKVKFDIKHDDRGNVSMQSMINPLPIVDDWALTPDGAIAFVRGRDYHVDWLNADGTRTSSPKIPFDWQRLTDDDKIAFIDSVKSARDRLGANAPVPLGGGPAGAAVGAGGGGGGPQIMIFGGPAGAEGRGGQGPARGGAGPMAQPPSFVPASELPDYKPPFFAGSTRTDTQGNLWIRTIPTSAIAGGPVYDVINRKGEIFERVQIPEGRTIAGFGANGAVYLLNRQGVRTMIEQASVR